MTETKAPDNEHEQRSDEWFKARLGKVTASRIGDILATIRNGNWAASRKNYAAQLVTERLSPENLPEPFDNEYMQWGREQEEPAVAAFTARTGVEVVPTGFVDHPDIPNAGASPDGLIGDDCVVEVKCPTTATHIETLLAGEIPEKHKYQMLWQIACTKRKKCQFISFDPRMPEDMQLFMQVYTPTKEEVAEIEQKVKVFLAEVDETIKALEAKFKCD
jgi:putative phage-type endonuclease